ncbi:MAG: DUF255 domain-containing protein [Bacteroidales bacterium]|nr:DUF255 domain-containing protein [Bacteroidales bacterium]
MKKSAIFLLFSLNMLATTQLQAQKIKWLSFEQAVEKSKKNPKKIFIDAYTDWCGWCVKMDQNTFSNAVIAAYINENFYPVKLNAERKDTVVFAGTTYINPNPDKKRSSHQLAQMLLQGRMSYPSYVFMGDDFRVLTVVPGYYPPKDFEPILHYFGEDAYKLKDWTSFQSTFKGKIKDD